MPKKQAELCSQCKIEETFDADVPIETHLRTLLKMWSSTYQEDMRTAIALLQATAMISEGWAEEQAAEKTGKVRKLRSLAKAA